jgi:hypothetical protein
VFDLFLSYFSNIKNLRNKKLPISSQVVPVVCRVLLWSIRKLHLVLSCKRNASDPVLYRDSQTKLINGITDDVVHRRPRFPASQRPFMEAGDRWHESIRQTVCSPTSSGGSMKKNDETVQLRPDPSCHCSFFTLSLLFQ